MLVKPGSQYCGEHQSFSDPDRIPCPYDPKHTCSASKLEKHLEICNSKPAANLADYLVTGINRGDHIDQTGEKLTVSSVSDEQLLRVIEKIETTFETFLAGTIEDKHLKHRVLDEELSNTDYGNPVMSNTITILGLQVPVY